jgi:hypothetical protein
MRFQTPRCIANWFYLAYNQYAFMGEQVFGVSIGRLYLGYYGHWFDRSGAVEPAGWCFGWLDKKGNLIEKR